MIVDAVRNSYFQARFDHKNNTVHFGGQVRLPAACPGPGLAAVHEGLFALPLLLLVDHHVLTCLPRRPCSSCFLPAGGGV